MSTLEDVCPNAQYTNGLDMFFLVVMGSLVFFMQAGFALLEAGSTGVTSVTSILFKNMADVLVGAIAWWATGYAFAYGEPDDGSSRFIGSRNYFLMDLEICDYANWFYQWTFAATAVTIVSGAMAGRTQLGAYLVYATMITGFIYPVVVHWTWSGNAWLTDGDENVLGIGYTDFAGSGIVHCTGGTAALVGAYWVGPRGTTKFENYDSKADIPGHSMPLVALGTFILFFGFIGFNGGSVLGLGGDTPGTMMSMPIMSLAVVNTVMAAAGGGVTAEAINWLVSGREFWSLMQICNGAIAGMVAICAGANVVWPWAAFVIGIGGGASFKLWSWGVRKCGIDDAIDAGAVHLGAGLWGLVAVTLFAMEPNDIVTTTPGGIFYDADKKEAWHRLAWNLIGGLVIILWTGGLANIMFFVLFKLKMLRVDDAVIEAHGGLDFVEHGEMAYIMFGVSKENPHSRMGSPTASRTGSLAGDVPVAVTATGYTPASTGANIQITPI